MTEVKLLGVTIHGLDMVETLCCIDEYIKLAKKTNAKLKEQQGTPKKELPAKDSKDNKANSKDSKDNKANSKVKQEDPTAPSILRHVITLNAEILYNAQTQPELMAIINRADLVTPDGSGIVWACKELGKTELPRLTGIDLMQEVCKQSNASNWQVFLFGGKPGVADEASKKLEAAHNTKVCGMAHGYFKPEEEEAIIQRINIAKPEILFVALGAPKQEFWIDKYRDRLQVPVVIGVGGSFDVIAGRVERAPEFFQKSGLEWLWRLLKEPWRYKRMLSLPKFVLLVKKQARANKK